MAKEMGKWSKEHVQNLKNAAVVGIAGSIPMLVQASPVNTGQYASSWDMSVGELNIILGNYAPHAPIIEAGARPFTPPIAPLLAWAKRVLQDGSQPPEYSPRVRALAWGVRKKIEKEGMKPRRVMEKALPMIIQNIKKEFEKIG